MTSADGTMDIDDFLVRLNNSIPDPVAKWMVFVLPVLSFMSLVTTIVIIILFRRQKKDTGVQRLVSCIMVLTTLCLFVRLPLSIMLLGNTVIFTDYLEYKWCEIFQRVNNDTPAVITNITALLKVGLAVQGLIMMFAPKKENVLMTSRKTVLFCLLCCATGVLVFMPDMELIRFIPIPWASKHHPDTARECCVPYPGDKVINVEYYQRDVHLGRLSVSHVFPIVVMVTVGILLTVRLGMLKRVSQSDDVVETYQQKEVIWALSVCMFAYIGLDLPATIQLLLVTLVYGLVDIGIDVYTTQDVLNYIGVAESLCTSLIPPVTLFVFCWCDTCFRATFMQLIRRRST